jgi:hypothetical protein
MRKLYGYRCAGAVVVALATLWAACPAGAAIPPDPDNAALLYYQAFISLPELDKEARDHVAAVARGTSAPTDKTRAYVEKCRQTLDFADAARGLTVCNWGFRYSQGFDAVMPYLAQIRFLGHVMLADARLRALEGDYRGALDRCLQMGTVARHVGDDPLISYLVAVAIQRLQYECMNDVIGRAAQDTELLRWLKNELLAAGETRLTPVTPLKVEMEIALNVMQVDKRDELLRILETAEQKNKDMAKLLASADEATMEQARQFYSQYVTSALAILGGPTPYEQAHRELTAPVPGTAADAPAAVIARFISPALASVLSAKTGVAASANATKAGLEILLLRAQTGRLPEVLPAGLPKDPFSGQDFEYKTTRNSFTLRCRGRDLAKDKTYEFEFKLK